MQNEENVVIILRRIEEKLDKVLQQAPRVKKEPKPKAAPTRNGHGVLEVAITQLLSEAVPAHVFGITQDINTKKLTPFPVKEAVVTTKLHKMWKAGQVLRIRKGVYLLNREPRNAESQS